MPASKSESESGHNSTEHFRPYRPNRGSRAPSHRRLAAWRSGARGTRATHAYQVRPVPVRQGVSFSLLGAGLYFRLICLNITLSLLCLEAGGVKAGAYEPS